MFAAYTPGLAAAYLTFDGLFALQHRGQESAGMAVSDGTQLWIDKDMGLVAQVFNDYKLAALRGHLAIGHTRYSTTGSSTWRNAQPVYRDTGNGGFALGHNGNLTNTAELAADAGMLPGVVASDSDLVAELLEHIMAVGCGLEAALVALLPRLAGAFSLVLCDVDARDRRPRSPRLPTALPRPAGGGGLDTRVGDAGPRRDRRPLRP